MTKEPVKLPLKVITSYYLKRGCLPPGYMIRPCNNVAWSARNYIFENCKSLTHYSSFHYILSDPDEACLLKLMFCCEDE